MESYTPRGVCSKKFEFEIDGEGKLTALHIDGGCDGNLKAISALIVGMDAREAADRMRGIRCGLKKTSCPDQLAKAIDAALEPR